MKSWRFKNITEGNDHLATLESEIAKIDPSYEPQKERFLNISRVNLEAERLERILAAKRTKAGLPDLAPSKKQTPVADPPRPRALISPPIPPRASGDGDGPELGALKFLNDSIFGDTREIERNHSDPTEQRAACVMNFFRAGIELPNVSFSGLAIKEAGGQLWMTANAKQIAQQATNDFFTTLAGSASARNSWGGRWAEKFISTNKSPALAGPLSLLKQYEAIQDPREKTEWYRKNKPAYDAEYTAAYGKK